jgi:hypothetical protein
MDKITLKKLILESFANVRLGAGVSLKQAEVMDNYGENCTTDQFVVLPQSEITDDWSKISEEELEGRPYLAHVDAEGFRYYLPALMCCLIEKPSSRSHAFTQVVVLLSPKEYGDELDRFSLLTPMQ